MKTQTDEKIADKHAGEGRACEKSDEKTKFGISRSDALTRRENRAIVVAWFILLFGYACMRMYIWYSPDLGDIRAWNDRTFRGISTVRAYESDLDQFIGRRGCFIAPAGNRFPVGPRVLFSPFFFHPLFPFSFRFTKVKPKRTEKRQNKQTKSQRYKK